MKIKDVEITKIVILESLISGKNSNLKADQKTGTILHEELSKTDLEQITDFVEVKSRLKLFDALWNVANNVNQSDGVLLFLEFHGNVNGITIYDDYDIPDYIYWSELTSLLIEINKNTAIGLVIVFSCCFGIYYFTQATINGISAYHLMFGCDEEINGPELLEINKKLINGIVNDQDIESLVLECNELINSGAKYSCVNLYDGLVNAYKDYFRDLFDKQKLIKRINKLVKKLPPDHPARVKPIKSFRKLLLSRDYNETKFNELRDRIFLADKHLLYHRFNIDFDDLCAELEIEDKFV